MVIPRITALLVASAVILVGPSAASANPSPRNAPPARSMAAGIPADPWAAHIAEAAMRFSIPARWIRAVMRTESNHDPRALSSKGAIGLMQIMPATWEELRTRHGLGDDPYAPRDNILGGAAYLRELHDRYGSLEAMLAAYNAGPGRYDRHIASGDPLPAETLDYIAKIVAMIEGGTPAALAAGSPAHVPVSHAPLFVARINTDTHDSEMANDDPGNAPSQAQTITDLSALAPPSHDLFVRRSGQNEAIR